MGKKVDIVVVNWNAGEKSLHAITPYLECKSPFIKCNVIVVDNASADDSVNILKDQFIKLIQNKKNVGFGKACNQAIGKSNADYILLLNPDTISGIDVLENLVQFLETNTDYGIVGPSQMDQNRNLMRSCARFPTFKTSLCDVLGLSKLFPQYFTPAPIMTDWNHLQSKDVDHVMGSYMLLRKSMLDQTGLMDEEYFIYFEDLDLSKRFSNAGFKTFYNNKYSIIHEAGGTGEKAESSRLYYSLSSRHTYWRKHFSKTSAFILTFFSITVEPLLRIIDSIINKNKTSVKKIGKAYYRYIRKIRKPEVMNEEMIE
jgi:GT2 family glycosyltransferase